MSRRLVAAGVLATVLAVPAAAATGTTSEEGLFTFQDARISESSGLVDLGALMVTTNDSGDVSRVFVVDPDTGATVGMTDFHSSTIDVEALAPAGPGEVWVGDIGDNGRSRPEVTVYRVPVGARQIDVASPTRFRLTYPDGPHDAESLFADPSGRLHLISKAPTGGTVYRAPETLDASGPNALEAVATVADYATDAAIRGDGRHVVVRGLGQASVYTFPAFGRVGTFPLPRQRQGEGISVGPGDRIRISSEGVGTAVEEVTIPADVLAALRPGAAEPSPRPTSVVRPAPARRSERGSAWLLWSIPAVLAVGAAGIGLGLRRRTG